MQATRQADPSTHSVLHFPPEQLTEQLARSAQWVWHLPPGQPSLHLEPGAHSNSQFPPGHCMLQSASSAQFTRHLPPPQSRLHLEPRWQLSWQPPPLQVCSQEVPAAHSTSHLPLSQAPVLAGAEDFASGEASADFSDSAFDPSFSVELPSEVSASAALLSEGWASAGAPWDFWADVPAPQLAIAKTLRMPKQPSNPTPAPPEENRVTSRREERWETVVLSRDIGCSGR